jgi:uncharacterized protein
MLIVLSPAKALNFEPAPVSAPLTTPELTHETAELAKVTRKLKAADLKRLMSLSDDLAKLNRDRFQAFDPESEEGLQAAFAFNGDVYQGLQARTLSKKDLAWAQDHVRILSGLYGLLRPLDAIQPYRLEMGSRLKTKRGQSLYDFWGSTIAEKLNEEHFGAVDRTALKLPVVTCRFLEEKAGQARMISFYAKRARGSLARWAILNRIQRAADVKGFDADGYRFDLCASDDETFTFVRPQPPPPSQQKKA